MRFFDLHCDTIGECRRTNASLKENRFDVSLKKAENLESYTQVFAIWIPDELRKQKAVDYFDTVCDYYEKELERNSDLITSFAIDNINDKRFKSILAVEGGAALGGTIEGLYHLKSRNVKILTLTWNAENEIASGAFCDRGGLTEFGRDVLATCEKLGIIADVSHLNRQSFSDVSKYATKPFIASHSNPDIVNTVKGRKRNLSDEQLDAVDASKGLIGINFYEAFLDVDGKNGVDAIAFHLDYLLERVSEDVIAIGSDFDGCKISKGLGDLSNIENVFNGLLKLGFDTELLDKIFYKNADDFFRK